MSQIAEATGIGRATLYKYFSDVKLTAASSLPSKAAVCRLVTVTLAGLRAAPDPTRSEPLQP
jgi:hypothetical protein